MIQIDLLRHGACEGGEIFRGHTDVALSPLGWQQMRDAVAQCANQWQSIWSSPLQRCLHFSNEQAAKHALESETHPAFQEISFGDWDGCRRDDLMQQQAGLYEKFYKDPLNNTPPNAESLLAFYDRVITGFEAAVRASNQEKVLLVSHGGTMRAILCWALGMPLEHFFRLDVPYAAISRLHIYRDGDTLYPQLMAHNSCGSMTG